MLAAVISDGAMAQRGSESGSERELCTYIHATIQRQDGHSDVDIYPAFPSNEVYYVSLRWLFALVLA